MITKRQEHVAAFSAALEEIYNNIENEKKVNFAEIGRKHNIKSYTPFIKKALREKHLINEDCTKWNPNYTIPNPQLAEQIYLKCKEYRRIVSSEYIERKKLQMEKIQVCGQEYTPYQEISEQKHLSLEETVDLVKHYGLFKIIWKCLF